MKKIFLLGEIKAKTAITVLFYTVIIPIIIKVYLSSKVLYGTLNFYSSSSLTKPMDVTNVIDTFVDNLNNKENSELLGVNDLGNPVLFVIILIIQLAVSLIVWKIICELLNKVFEYFDKNKKNEVNV